MDLLQFFVTLISTVVVLICVSSFRSKRRSTVPMAGGAWPIVGHMLLYVRQAPTHRILGRMADNYGPIFATRIGSYPVLVVSSHEIAKEFFTVHDKAMDRPSILASRLLGYNDTMLTFSPYGSYWREMRKIATMELLSNQRIDILKHAREAEMAIAARGIYSTWESKGRPENGIMVNMSQKLKHVITNMSLRMVAGKRYFGDISEGEEEEELRKCGRVVTDFLHLFTVYAFSDYLPSFGWLDDWGHGKAMKRTAKELDKIVEGWVEEHRKERAVGGKDKESQDFLDVMLKAVDGSNVSGMDTDTILKAICLNFVLAGSETAIVVVIWALGLLVNNPDAMKKAQEELDIHVGKTRHVDESDIKDLVYLHAVVKETIRLHPPVPLLSQRTVLEDFTISKGNYHIPAGTGLMLNAWKIHRDPSVWPEPDRFDPERFLTTHKDIDVGGQSFKLLAFGLGRRSCPASSLGLRMSYYVLASVLHGFDLAKPSGQDVDMAEINGLTNLKATPLEVLVTPRLDPKLYGVVV